MESSESLPSGYPSAKVVRIGSAPSAPTKEFSNLDLLPVRCYSCGKVIFQSALEHSLETGQTLAETMNELGYMRICCRGLIMSAPAIVKLQKQLEREKYTMRALTSLTLEATSGMSVRQFPVQPERISSLNIIDEAPPGIPRQAGICFVPTGESYLPPDEDVDPFEVYMEQI